MPLGVTVCTQQIFDAFYADDTSKTFFHGHSYTANPLACAAANASMELLVGEKCQQQIQFICERHQHFAASIQNNKLVKEVRQQGTILGIEIKTGEATSYFNSIQQLLYDFYLSQNIFLRPLGNVVYIMPPYCITNEELDKVYAAIKDSFIYLEQEIK